jgi:RNA polymerase sigma-70 factor (ECF subfamily)
MRGALNFKDVYDEYHPKILRYVTKIAGKTDADDITQDVFEKISRGIVDFEGRSKLSTWIYRIATNTTLDRLRSASVSHSKKESAMEENADLEDRDSWSGQKKGQIDKELIRKEMSECVREYVDKLPPDQRTAIVLSEIEGFKNREIAEILEISLDNVKIRLHRARTSLKKLLDDGCDFYQNEQATLACDRKPPVLKFKKSK